MLAKGQAAGAAIPRACLRTTSTTTSAARANEQAYRIAAACREAGFPFFAASPTNQQFPHLPPTGCWPGSGRSTPSPVWAKVDEAHTAVRLCTSWATREEAVDQLLGDIRALGKEL